MKLGGYDFIKKPFELGDCRECRADPLAGTASRLHARSARRQTGSGAPRGPARPSRGAGDRREPGADGATGESGTGKCRPYRCTMDRRAPADLSSSQLSRDSRRRWLKASSSVTKRAPSPDAREQAGTGRDRDGGTPSSTSTAIGLAAQAKLLSRRLVGAPVGARRRGHEPNLAAHVCAHVTREAFSSTGSTPSPFTSPWPNRPGTSLRWPRISWRCPRGSLAVASRISLPRPRAAPLPTAGPGTSASFRAVISRAALDA